LPKFSDWADAQDENEMFGGAFDCQTCGECVTEAHYNAPERLLTWKCSKGHTSLIKDFMA